MNLKDTFLLGLVLGATEYLPVGASGHMTFLNEVLRLNTIPNMAVILMQMQSSSQASLSSSMGG